MEYVIVSGILFLGGFIQGLSGFGSALIAMPLLMPLLGVRLAPPVMVAGAFVGQLFMLLWYRRAFYWRNIWRLSVASVFMIPVGVFLVRMVDEHWVFGLLATVLIAYSLYALFKLKLPALHHSGWAFVAGGLAGVLGGACNTDGPPVIIYGHCRKWNRQEFKGNLQGFFMVNSCVILATHFAVGNMNAEAFPYMMVAIPSLVAGAWLGLSLDRFIHVELFHKICLVLLLVLGLRLGVLALGA